MRHLLLFILFTLFATAATAQVSRDDLSRKKFIELGWDIPNTAYLKEHHEEMQRTTPFDGVMLALEATDPGGKRCSTEWLLDAQRWEATWFAQAVADLKACRWTTFTDNFVRVNFTPGAVEWDDDAGWEAVCAKTAICAQVAKETGLTGLAVDFEPYGKAIFKYDVEDGRTFEEMKQVVCKRGRQWMEAMAGVYPEMVLFTLFIADVNLPAGYEHCPDDSLVPMHYGLLPAFFDGMLDAVPPEMWIVDGCETGYYKNGVDEYARLALAIQSIGGPAIRLVAPENRQKYINQVQVGLGFYLDMYTNPEGDVYYRGPKEGGTRLGRLDENLAAARETTDEYVWLYGEHRRWWKPADEAAAWEHWDEAMPGMGRAIRFIKNPREAAKHEAAMLWEEGRVENLLTGEWIFWQDKPLGKFSRDGGLAKVSGVKWGCVLQNVRPVKPGEYYYVSIDGRQEAAGLISMRIRWQDAEGIWTREAEDRIFPFGKESDRFDGREVPEGWQRAEGVVRIPEGVGVIQVQAGVRDQAEDDTAWFGDAVLIRLR